MHTLIYIYIYIENNRDYIYYIIYIYIIIRIRYIYIDSNPSPIYIYIYICNQYRVAHGPRRCDQAACNDSAARRPATAKQLAATPERPAGQPPQRGPQAWYCKAARRPATIRRPAGQSLLYAARRPASNSAHWRPAGQPLPDGPAGQSIPCGPQACNKKTHWRSAARTPAIESIYTQTWMLPNILPPLWDIRSFSDRLVIAATPLSDGRRALNGCGKKAAVHAQLCQTQVSKKHQGIYIYIYL